MILNTVECVGLVDFCRWVYYHRCFFLRFGMSIIAECLFLIIMIGHEHASVRNYPYTDFDHILFIIIDIRVPIHLHSLARSGYKNDIQ